VVVAAGMVLVGLVWLCWAFVRGAGPGPATEIGSLSHRDSLPVEAGHLSDCNLLLVTLDTTRADRLGVYGNSAIKTPTLDHLAATGVVFSTVTAVAPLTLPAHASLMTGRYPTSHGVRANGLFRLGDEFETLAERLLAAGYRTGAVVSSFVLDEQFGLSQGFEVYDDNLGEGQLEDSRHYREQSAAVTTERALRWLKEVRTERFFLWVHYFDPHHEYAPPSPFAERYADNAYDGEIAYVDDALGRLLDGLAGSRSRTLVAVVGDHGEGLGQHSEMTHSYLSYDATLRVPLILQAGERLGGGVHIARPVSQVDVAPMLASLLGVPFAGGGVTQDLFAPAKEEHPVFFETLAGRLDYGWEPLFGVAVGHMKYIHSSVPELYDRERDPDELVNLAPGDPATTERLGRLVRDMFSDDLAAVPTPSVDLGLEDLERLQGLGYMGGGNADPAPVAAGLTPQSMMRYLTRVELAQDKSKPIAESIAELEAVLAEQPDFYPAWKGLGNAHRRVPDLEAAARVLQRCIELRPGIPQTVFELALVRAHRRQTDEVLELLEPIARSYPNFVPARYLLGSTLAGVRRFDEALVHLRAVFDLDPDHERCLEHLVMAYIFASRREELLTVLGKHLEAHPEASKVRAALTDLKASASKPGVFR